MTAGERSLSALWHDIDSLLARARTSRPLQQSDALLDLDRLPGDAATPLLEKLARAMDGWEGRLLLRAADDALAPEVRAGDQLVIDPAIAACDCHLVVAFAAGALTPRRLRARAGQNWLEAGSIAPVALGPLVAILGVVIELRRAL